jgi:hypothetical protein
VLLIDCLGDKKIPWITGNPSRVRGGDLVIYNNLDISMPWDEAWIKVRWC